MNELQTIGTPKTRRDGDQGSVGIAIAGFDLVNVGKVGRGLKTGIQFEFPVVGDGVSKKSFEVVR